MDTVIGIVMASIIMVAVVGVLMSVGLGRQGLSKEPEKSCEDDPFCDCCDPDTHRWEDNGGAPR